MLLDDQAAATVCINYEDFNFANFDAWVRSRFGLHHDIKLSYVRDNGKGRFTRKCANDC